VEHVSRSIGLLRVEASLAMVSRSGHKTGVSATTGGVRDTIMEVASRIGRKRMGRCDGLCWTLLPLLCHLLVLGHRGIVVF
jgi:hypothetical protein